MVDKSLSRGLADRVVDEMAGLARAYVAQSSQALKEVPETRHAVRRATGELMAAGERAACTQLVGAHPRWRWSGTCAFVPEVHASGGCEHNRTIAFFPFRAYLHAGRGALVRCEERAALAIQEHAVERLFLRLNVHDAAAVREEMHDATCLAPFVLPACVALGLRQVVLPTRCGAFLCSVERGTLVAKTWIANVEGRSRHTPVVEAIRRFHEAIGGEREVAQRIASLAIDIPLEALEADESLVQALAPFEWLRQAYQPRPDPVGETWRNAQMQARMAA